jgi:Tfp pilus assembly protein PilZ
MGCDFIQGFIFSAALDVEEFEKYLATEGRRISIRLAEARVLSSADPVGAERPAAKSGAPIVSEDLIAPVEAPTREQNTGDSAERYALVIDDDRLQIGRTAMRMNQMGIPSYYARNPDEAVLFALQEPGRIRAILVSSETNPDDVERVAQQISTQLQGDRPSIVVVGEKFDPAVIADLQQKGPVWSLRIPFDDAELNFVADAALSNASETSFSDRNRVPIHLTVWTRMRDVTGHGVISSLSPRGAFIEMKNPLPVGTAFQLEFSLSDWPVSLRARVVYLVGKGAGEAGRPEGVGVVFLDRDRETGDRIVEEVEKRSARYIP